MKKNEKKTCKEYVQNKEDGREQRRKYVSSIDVSNKRIVLNDPYVAFCL